MLFSPDDRDRISAAIAAAEDRTSGEIVVIAASEPLGYPATALSFATGAALTLPLIAVLLGWQPASLFPEWEADARGLPAIEGFAMVQALVFVAVLGLVYFTSLARWLTPPGLRRDRVHAAALTQFKARGFEATAGRNGVLLYIAEPEHIAEVIADSAVFARVPPDHWGATILALTEGIKAGKAADGVIAAIGLAGEVLAAHFPAVAGDVNELPDRLIEI